MFSDLPSENSRNAGLPGISNSTRLKIRIDGLRSRWFCLERDLDALTAAGRKRSGSHGTTFLCPFDSLMWHRERLPALFDFEYRIEVYVPAPKRTFGYYVLPILHDGHFIGRIDVKVHRELRLLALRHVHFEKWFVEGGKPGAACWGSVAPAKALAGVAAAAHSLAEFVGATGVKLGRVTPRSLAAPLRAALGS